LPSCCTSHRASLFRTFDAVPNSRKLSGFNLQKQGLVSRSYLWHVCAGFWELWNLISQCLPLCLLASLPLCLPQCLPLCLLLCRTSRTLDPVRLLLGHFVSPLSPSFVSHSISRLVAHFLSLNLSPTRSPTLRLQLFH